MGGSLLLHLTGDVLVKMVDDEEEALHDSSRSAEQKKKLCLASGIWESAAKNGELQGPKVFHAASSQFRVPVLPQIPHVFSRFFIVRGTFHRPRTPDMPRLGPSGMTLSPSSQHHFTWSHRTTTNSSTTVPSLMRHNPNVDYPCTLTTTLPKWPPLYRYRNASSASSNANTRSTTGLMPLSS